MTDMRNRLCQHISIPSYDVDVAQLLKASSFMELAQEAANLHADILGFGYDSLMRTRTAWVLSRIHIHFSRHPRWREETDFSTWHKGARGLFYLRDFLMTDSEGETLVSATSSWLVLNIDTRRIVRDSGVCTEDICLDNAIGEPCGKVQFPSDLEKELACVHTVSYSDVDMNGHTNNTMYLVWAMDAAGYDLVSTRPVHDVRINFSHETRPGEAVSIYRAERKLDGGGTVCHIEGEIDGRQAFSAELEF